MIVKWLHHTYLHVRGLAPDYSCDYLLYLRPSEGSKLNYEEAAAT